MQLHEKVAFKAKRLIEKQPDWTAQQIAQYLHDHCGYEELKACVRADFGLNDYLNIVLSSGKLA